MNVAILLRPGPFSDYLLTWLLNHILEFDYSDILKNLNVGPKKIKLSVASGNCFFIYVNMIPGQCLYSRMSYIMLIPY